MITVVLLRPVNAARKPVKFFGLEGDESHERGYLARECLLSRKQDRDIVMVAIAPPQFSMEQLMERVDARVRGLVDEVKVVEV